MGPEWFVVIGVVVLLFGGSQLPKLAKSIGQAKNEFEKGVSEGEAGKGDKPVDRTATSDDTSKS